MKTELKPPIINGKKNNSQNASPSKPDEDEKEISTDNLLGKLEKNKREVENAAAKVKEEHRKIKLAILIQDKVDLGISIQEKLAEVNQANNVASQQETNLRRQEVALKRAIENVVFKNGELQSLENSLKSKEKQIGNC